MMIKNSFVFLPKIGIKKEEQIWKQGIKDWDDFLNVSNIKGISNNSKKYYDKLILEAKKAIYENNSSFFIGKLPNIEMWRLYDYFKEESIFLDIETSGVNGYLTIISIFDGINVKTMTKFNFDINALKKELKKYKLIITFNGSSFDIPFLNRNYQGLLPNVPNIDVRHLCNKIGLKGGLKEIEKMLNIKRENEIVNKIYDGDPFKLWKIFKVTGDYYYLNLLVEYNQEDVINLKKIIEYCISELKEKYKKE